MNQHTGGPQHDADVFKTRENLWRARCSCGWRGELRPSRYEAEGDASAHHKAEVDG